MIEKEFDQINEQDLQGLVDNAVVEQKTLEYKQELPVGTDSAKKEFLADVSSFANASGGDIVYGIVEDRDSGKPKELRGLDIGNPDQERLDSIIRDGVKPRIPSIAIEQIPLSNSKCALLIRIGRSWSSPHCVTLGGHDKFYSRTSNGKYQLDVTELRAAFNLSETVVDRIRNFRLERVSKITANETPVQFIRSAKIILHLIPIGAFNPAQTYDIKRFASDNKLEPIYSSGWSTRYNLDGWLSYQWNGELSHSYCQLFRNGILEAANGTFSVEEDLRIHPAYEKELVAALKRYMLNMKSLSIEPPIFVFLTLTGVKGYRMSLSRERYFALNNVHTIDRDVLQLPEVIIENYDAEPAKILKPCFDSIWNACGLQGSLNYNAAGDWAPN